MPLVEAYDHNLSTHKIALRPLGCVAEFAFGECSIKWVQDFIGGCDEAELRVGSGACMHATFNLDVWPKGSDNYTQKTLCRGPLAHVACSRASLRAFAQTLPQAVRRLAPGQIFTGFSVGTAWVRPYA